MKLTEHFTLEEFTRSQTATDKHIPNNPNAMQISNLTNLCVNVLEPLHNILNQSIFISSGFRSVKLNRAVGGVPNSQHQTGEAADIDAKPISPQALFDIIRNSTIPFDQLILEFDKWVHISFKIIGNRNEKLVYTLDENGNEVHTTVG